jgi:hypothetical protein
MALLVKCPQNHQDVRKRSKGVDLEPKSEPLLISKANLPEFNRRENIY